MTDNDETTPFTDKSSVDTDPYEAYEPFNEKILLSTKSRAGFIRKVYSILASQLL